MAAYLVRLVTGLEISVSVALMECAGCAVILYLLEMVLGCCVRVWSLVVCLLGREVVVISPRVPVDLTKENWNFLATEVLQDSWASGNTLAVADSVAGRKRESGTAALALACLVGVSPCKLLDAVAFHSSQTEDNQRRREIVLLPLPAGYIHFWSTFHSFLPQILDCSHRVSFQTTTDEYLP